MTEHKQAYNSNPFTLAFGAMTRIFDTNAVWAIVFVVVGIFGAIWQIVGNLASLVPSSSTDTATSTSSAPLTSGESTALVAIIIVVAVIALVFFVIGIVVQVYLEGMFAYVALQSEKGKPVGFGEAFRAVTKRFWRLLGAKLLAGLKIFLWTLLFIIPGIIAAFRYALLSYVIMDEPETNKGIGASHTRTKTIVKGRLIEVFGLSFATGIIPVVGGLLQLVGGAAQYNQLAESYDSKAARPAKHWLNYIGFIVIGLLLVMFAGFLALLVAFAASS